MNKIIIRGINKDTKKADTQVVYNINQEKRIKRAIDRALERGYKVEIKYR